MNDRQTIFSAIQKALEPLPKRTPYPEWPEELSVSSLAANPAESSTDSALKDENAALVSLFKTRLTEAKGVFVEGWGALHTCLKELGVSKGYLDPTLVEALHDQLPGLSMETRIRRDRIDEYEFGITPASGAIAETGTLILRDADTPYRLGALAPWVHVAVLQREHLLPTVAAAISQLGSDPSIIFVTGPSKTADIEGILIQGVHGPGCQICCLV